MRPYKYATTLPTISKDAVTDEEGDVDDDDMAEKFEMATPTGANYFGPHGDKMPVTPERELPAYPESDLTFSLLTAIGKSFFRKAMFG